MNRRKTKESTSETKQKESNIIAASTWKTLIKNIFKTKQKIMISNGKNKNYNTTV